MHLRRRLGHPRGDRVSGGFGAPPPAWGDPQEGRPRDRRGPGVVAARDSPSPPRVCGGPGKPGAAQPSFGGRPQGPGSSVGRRLSSAGVPGSESLSASGGRSMSGDPTSRGCVGSGLLVHPPRRVVRDPWPAVRPSGGLRVPCAFLLVDQGVLSPAVFYPLSVLRAQTFAYSDRGRPKVFGY